jgi:DNA-binding transcriptional LysR family regulator
MTQMTNVSLDDLRAFAAVARHCNFRRAAQEMVVSPSAISQMVRRLEDQLGIALLNRSTRSVSPTAAGERLAERLTATFDDVTSALNEVTTFKDQPTGLVRINAPRPVAQLMLAPLVSRFLAAVPGVSVELTADDAMIDVVEQRYDAGVRFGESLHKDVIAARLGSPQRMLILAAPAYLAVHGKPQSIEDLTRHNLIQHRFPGGKVFDWELEQEGRPVLLTPKGTLIVNDPHTKICAAIDGAGLAFEFEGYAKEALAQGRLVSVMPDWCPYVSCPNIYFPSKNNMSAAVRAFIDFVRAAAAKLPVP